MPLLSVSVMCGSESGGIDTHNMRCPYDGGRVLTVHSSHIYGEHAPDYGLMKACENYPECDAYGRTTVANKELRELRKECHRRFDPIWQSGRKSRNAAYLWMGRQLKLSRQDAHISLLDADQCRALLAAIEHLNQ